MKDRNNKDKPVTENQVKYLTFLLEKSGLSKDEIEETIPEKCSEAHKLICEISLEGGFKDRRDSKK